MTAGFRTYNLAERGPRNILRGSSQEKCNRKGILQAYLDKEIDISMHEAFSPP